MSKQIISNMPTDKFDTVIDAFIERETRDMGELDAPLFYEALREMITSETSVDSVKMLEVEGEIVDNQLVLDLPIELEFTKQMRDIAILVGDRRISVKWKNDTTYPFVH